MEALRDRGEHQHRFHHRKACADALSWPTTKRVVGEAGQPFRQAVLPPLWPKLVRILEVSRVSMERPHAQNQGSPTRDRVPTELAVHQRLTSKAGHRWVQA